MLGAIIVVAAALRLATLGSQSFWVDESTTVHELRMSLGGLMHQISVNETTPPLYFVVAWIWAHGFGTGEVGLRLLSALCGIATVPVVFACAGELFSRRVALVAAGLAAINPFLIWYSQEARAYASLLLLLSLALLFWLRALRTGGHGAVAAWAACAGLAVLTHFFAVFLIAPQALWLLARRRERTVILACAALVAVQAAVLPLALGDTHHPLGWINAFPLATRLQQVPVQFGLGQLYQDSLVAQGLAGAALVAAVVAALIVLGGYGRERRGAALLAGLAAASILVPVGLAELGRDYIVPRNLIGAWVPLSILIALGCLAPRARVAGLLLLAGTVGGFIWADVRTAGDAALQRPPWHGVADVLGPAPVPRAIAASDGNFATEPLSIYLPEARFQAPGPAPVTVQELDLVAARPEQLIARLPPGVRQIESRTVGSERVWRLALTTPWRLPPAAIGARAASLLDPAPPGAAVLLQQPGASHLA